jgi:hypothetical protein
VELIDFAHERLYPTKTPERALQPDIYPRWFGSSQLFWDGGERVAILIDWNQGPQAVKSAMERWFQRHKRGLARLKSEGKLPDATDGSYMFHVRDETGAKNPRRKYMTALRGLGAMRLLGTHTLLEAIKSTKGSLYSRDLRSRSAWSVGIRTARKKFQELFYPQDEDSVRIRRHYGLPEIEEPISYQRYCLRTRKNK